MKNIKIAVVAALGLLLSNQVLAGGTTVGDGGMVVRCGKQDTFLDIYEQDVLVGPKAISLAQSLAGSDKKSVEKMVQVGIDRARQRFQLSEDELTLVQKAAKIFLSFQYDDSTERAGRLLPGDFLVPDVRLAKIVYEKIKRDGCDIIVAVVRAPETPEARKACLRLANSFESCFIGDRELFRWMDPSQKACLILHESLRSMPPHKKITNEMSFRRTVAELCTQ